MSGALTTVVTELQEAFASTGIVARASNDDVPTVSLPADAVPEVLHYLKNELHSPFSMLYDLTAIDERERRSADGTAAGADFSVVYHLLSLERNQDLRLKTAVRSESPSVPSITSLWPAANWYEREVWDMFGIRFDGHPNLSRILMPRGWSGHPLCKNHPARATEMEPPSFSDEWFAAQEEALRFDPAEWGLEDPGSFDTLYLNLGPQHPGTHGVLRVVLQLDGEQVVAAVPEIGFHHRGAEKMGERQSWHTYIPYTDRIDYLGGVLNNLPYLLAVERLSGVEVPERAQVIRVMLCELFRIISHLVWYGTFAQDVGALSPVFYTFSDRERAFDAVAAICGDRMHPNWFRIGGVAQDLPEGWREMLRDFVAHLGPRLDEYDRMVMKNRIFRARTQGIGAYSLAEALEWGVTGPGLRACGLAWDLRKKRPYSGYENFDFEIPVGQRGDCYDRAVVRVEEMRQSLRIISQCLEHMPEGEHRSRDVGAVPPLKQHHTMADIETLIHHFLGVSWGPVVPAGEAHAAIEASKGVNGYYLISDGGPLAYRVRIRTPSFPHLQMLSLICQGHSVADVLAILGSIDFVLADVDR